MELIFRQRLDRPDSKGRAAIFADLHWHGGHRWKMPTGVSVLPAHWQPAKNKRINTSAPNASALNVRLVRLLEAVQNVFLQAEAQKRPESSVTRAELLAAVRENNAGSRRAVAPEPVIVDPNAPLPETSTWQQLHDRWQADNQGRLSESMLAGYQQVVLRLTEFDSTLRLANLTKERATAYISWLFARGYKDSTASKHFGFLRECCQLAGRLPPKWLTVANPRFGRAVSLQRAELVALARCPLPAKHAAERDVFLFQLLLLLRDSDLRALKPHHVRAVELPEWGLVQCVELYQQKTGEPVLIPLPPLAVAIWQHYGGRLPVRSNTTRNQGIREAARRAELNREFVEVAFSGKYKHEAVLPTWEALSTHAARHTGAALLVWASDGDQTLKELALGHVSASVYGYDSVERYGPQLLQAWQKVFSIDRGLFPENRGQPVELPPVGSDIPTVRRPFMPVTRHKAGNKPA